MFSRTPIHAALLVALLTPLAAIAAPSLSSSLVWRYEHGAADYLAEIPAYDARTNTLWVAGVVGVDVFDVSTRSFIQHIDTRSWGGINSVAIHNGIAAFAFENTTDRAQPGVVTLFDTGTRSLLSGTNTITVGALPDMLIFTPDGSRLLVANEGTPTTYGKRIGTSVPRVYGTAADDPAGSVSIIDMSNRSVIATAGLAGVAQTGSHIRTNTGMDFEPEYIGVNAAGTEAYVSLQEANAMAVLDLQTNSFSKIVGLGYKDFSAPGNSIDPLNDGIISFGSYDVKGLYMPDSLAAYDVGGKTYVVMANEGDFREDNGDRSAAGKLEATSPLNNLRISNTDSSAGNYFAAGARSFSIRDSDGNIVFDSGDQLDRKAAELGIYDDGRSRDKGVEPEGVALKEIDGRTYAFIGLERTLKGAVAIYDITDPANSLFVDMIVTDGDRAPEGLVSFSHGGTHYLAIANEVSNTTSVYALTPVPEPSSWVMLMGGLGLLGFMVRRKRD